jgi:hypothetical protein
MSTTLVYQIRINWFVPLVVANAEDGEAILTGPVRDQAELAGLLNRIFDLNLTLLSVNRTTDPAE